MEKSPHQSLRSGTGQACTQCSALFEITKEDLAFYDKVSPEFGGKKYSVPPPTLCPACRWQRRIASRNERKLYHRKCDLTGKQMISMHPAGTPFPVYYITDWLGGSWDSTTYGRDMDFSRPFFEQFSEMANQVPHFNLFIDPQMDQNSEFTNCSSEAKNCYMISQAEKNEDCYYSRGINSCKNCCDCLRVHRCELCYECVNANNCYSCRYCQDCDNCNDCYFSTDLRGCKNCFGCHSLVQKEYHIFNKPVSKGEWEEKIGTLILTHSMIAQAKMQSAEFRLTVPQRAAHILQCENSTGDHITECRGSKEVFDSKNLEHCAYCNEVLNGAKDCYDYSMWGIDCELLYECNGCGYNAHHLLFSNHCWNNVSELLYCESCFPSVNNCFGCFGLQRKQYCILNKQYTKEEYEALVPKIIEHMRKLGEWGEFFPISISAYPYNDGLAQEYFPLTKKDVTARGWRWQEEKESRENYMGPPVEVPESIGGVDDEITKKILLCEITQKPYRIIAQELKLYRQLAIPLPRICPEERHRLRVTLRNPRKLWKRQCDKCQKEIETTYNLERPEIIYCEECYLATVY